MSPWGWRLQCPGKPRALQPLRDEAKHGQALVLVTGTQSNQQFAGDQATCKTLLSTAGGGGWSALQNLGNISENLIVELK